MYQVLFRYIDKHVPLDLHSKESCRKVLSKIRQITRTEIPEDRRNDLDETKIGSKVVGLSLKLGYKKEDLLKYGTFCVNFDTLGKGILIEEQYGNWKAGCNVFNDNDDDEDDANDDDNGKDDDDDAGVVDGASHDNPPATALSVNQTSEAPLNITQEPSTSVDKLSTNIGEPAINMDQAAASEATAIAHTTPQPSCKVSLRLERLASKRRRPENILDDEEDDETYNPEEDEDEDDKLTKKRLTIAKR